MGRNNVKKLKPKKKRGKGYIIFVTLFVLCSIGISSVAMFYNYLFQFSSLAKGRETNPTNVTKIQNLSNKANKKTDPVTVLIIGIDSGNTVDKTAVDEPKRTDTMIVMRYDPKDKAATLVSVPRDTMVFINGERQKINAAHAIGGINLSVKEVEELLDIDIDYYARLDYQGFRELVDDIGGVEVTIQNDMIYDDPGQNLKIRFKKGETVLLNGKKAEEFFRWRENNDGTGLLEGDIGRIQNEQVFISKVLDKVKSISIIPKIPSILETLPKYIETNMPPDEILGYGLSFLNVDKSKVKMQTLNGLGGEASYVNGISYFMYDKTMNEEILNRLNGIYRSERQTELNPLKLKINILNGTGKEKNAWDFSENLKEQGYEYVYVDNSNKANNISSVDVYNVDESLRESLVSVFGIENMTFHDEDNGEYNIVINLGKDYDSIVSKEQSNEQ